MFVVVHFGTDTRVWVKVKDIHGNRCLNNAVNKPKISVGTIIHQIIAMARYNGERRRCFIILNITNA
jgi:hypothetical protein